MTLSDDVQKCPGNRIVDILKCAYSNVFHHCLQLSSTCVYDKISSQMIETHLQKSPSGSAGGNLFRAFVNSILEIEDRCIIWCYSAQQTFDGSNTSHFVCLPHLQQELHNVRGALHSLTSVCIQSAEEHQLKYTQSPSIEECDYDAHYCTLNAVGSSSPLYVANHN